MIKKLPEKYEKFKQKHPFAYKSSYGDPQGFFRIPIGKKTLSVMVGSGGGWDHVSVSLKHRCPTWEEMCFIKNIFFEKNELVIQFHPPEENYYSFHKYCLHMWKPWHQKIELPPMEFL